MDAITPSFEVMVVNDDAAQLAMLAGLLKKDGCNVRTCGSAEEAMSSLDDVRHMNLLITDLNMPGLSGLQLLYKLRELGLSLPVLIISASEHDSDGMRGRIEREKAHLLAPYSTAEVRQSALSLLRGEPLAPSPQPHRSRTKKPLDKEAVAKLEAVGGKALVQRVVGMFLHKTPANLVQLRECIEQGDAHTIERTAHTVKGSAGMLGALHVQHAAKNLEIAAAAGEAAKFAECLREMEEAYAEILPFYEELCAE